VTKSEPTKPSKPRRGWLVRSIPILVLLALAGGVATLVGLTCHRDDQIRDARNAFIDKLTRGDVEGAYGELTAERRAAMSLQEFNAYIDHPVLTALDEGNYTYPTEHHPGACVEGEIDMPDGQWQLQFFFLEEDRWRLHSIALQRPATVGLARLLPECGFWKGTMAGYSGPPPEHATKPTRNYD
jgi:hypothetical protein